MHPQGEDLRGYLKRHTDQQTGSKSELISEAVLSKIVEFYEIILKENEVQNLTRLISPSDFYYGHVIDVLELIQTGWLKYPAVDLGSGVGIPGLLANLIQPGQWILIDSEKKKAEYLSRTVEGLGLGGQIQVFSGRGEDYLKKNPVHSVVLRAVGPIERISGWMQGCSTWNQLILFKGPSWVEEWAVFQKTRLGKGLVLQSEHLYTVGPEEKRRVLVRLTPSK